MFPIHAVLTFLLLLRGTAMPFETIKETQYKITCTLPASVSNIVGIQYYTFLKLTDNKQLSTESIFMEYTIIGMDGQLPISRLITADQLETTSRWDDWSSTIQIHVRVVVVNAVMRVGKIALLQGRVDAHILVCRILDGIRGTTGWVEFAAYLVNVEDSVWDGVVEEALGRILVVTELESTILVELPGSIASELGATSFQLLKIDKTTSTRQIFNEFRYGILGQKTVRDLIHILAHQKDDGKLSQFQHTIWYSHGALMLSERRYIIEAILMIAKADPSLNVSDIISIFEWKRGGESLLEFTHQLSHYELFN
jgi:hypothetical protein